MSIDFMDEGGAEQERKPIISNLFPVSRDSVSKAFGDLSPRENPSGAQLKTNEEKRILDEKNPHVSTYFSDFAQEMRERKASEEAINQVSVGAIIIGHRALREEARFKGGVLPSFTEEFVKDYHNKDVERIRTMSIDKKLTVQEAAIQLGKMAIVKFENWEPEFSRILREKLGLQSDWRPEDDLVYLGIVEQYLLFREGCKDPKNFQK